MDLAIGIIIIPIITSTIIIHGVGAIISTVIRRIIIGILGVFILDIRHGAVIMVGIGVDLVMRLGMIPMVGIVVGTIIIMATMGIMATTMAMATATIMGITTGIITVIITATIMDIIIIMPMVGAMTMVIGDQGNK